MLHFPVVNVSGIVDSCRPEIAVTAGGLNREYEPISRSAAFKFFYGVSSNLEVGRRTI